MTFEPLIQIEGMSRRKAAKAVAKSWKKGVDRRGCNFCPLNDVKGIRKIFGKVRGKKIFVWAQSPGFKENYYEKELIGPAGTLLWNELEAVGITRQQCDIQNIVRCFPADRVDGNLEMRNPAKEEIKCCSVYNEKAIEKAQARIHLVFGQMAAKSLFGREYRKDKRIFWSDKLRAWVVCLDHPAFFLRGGSKSRLDEFRKQLKHAARLLKVKKGGKFGYLKSRKYIGVTTRKLARQAERDLRRRVMAGERISGDFEEGLLDDRGRPTTDGTGTRTGLVMGYSAQAGVSYVFPTGHPSAPVRKKDRRFIARTARRLWEDPRVKKVMQHGNYDVTAVRKLEGWKCRGYDYDTEYADYLDDVEQHSYALGAIVDRRFPQFAGYKEIVAPEAITEKFRKRLGKRAEKMSRSELAVLARKSNGLNLALLPWQKMVWYNGADNDVQKRIEIQTRDKINHTLLKIYMDAAVVLKKMEDEDAPLFDYWHYDRVVKLFPVRRDTLLKKIRKITHNKDFNPNSPVQVSTFIYKKLRLPVLGKTPDTQASTLERLKQYHPFPGMQLEVRKLFKACSTYLEGYKICADLNKGHLRTIWRLTGTRTGRLSSGGKEDVAEIKVSGRTNLQNIHGDPQLQNLLISDKRWRKIYKYWLRHGPFTSDSKIPRWIQKCHVFLGRDQSQMELRVVAQKSGDKELIKIFSTKPKWVETKPGKWICKSCNEKIVDCGCGDPHSLVGHALTGWPVERIKNDDRTRRMVKNMQFGIVFGLTEDNLIPYMRAKGVSEKDASDQKIKSTYRKYFRRFTGVQRMIDNAHAFAKKYGFVQTMLGMKRKIRVSDQKEEGGFWGNIAVNTPVQGTAHQAMLTGLVPLKRKRKQYKYCMHPQLEVHDALYFRSLLKNLWKCAKQSKRLLEKEPLEIIRNEFKIDWKVPFVTDAKAGFRFGVMVKLDKIKDKSLSAFLNAWCARNQVYETTLQLFFMDVKFKGSSKLGKLIETGDKESIAKGVIEYKRLRKKYGRKFKAVRPKALPYILGLKKPAQVH